MKTVSINSGNFEKQNAQVLRKMSSVGPKVKGELSCLTKIPPHRRHWNCYRSSIWFHDDRERKPIRAKLAPLRRWKTQLTDRSKRLSRVVNRISAYFSYTSDHLKGREKSTVAIERTRVCLGLTVDQTEIGQGIEETSMPMFDHKSAKNVESRNLIAVTLEIEDIVRPRTRLTRLETNRWVISGQRTVEVFEIIRNVRD